MYCFIHLFSSCTCTAAIFSINLLTYLFNCYFPGETELAGSLCARLRSTTAQMCSNSLPSYPPDNHHSSGFEWYNFWPAKAGRRTGASWDAVALRLTASGVSRISDKESQNCTSWWAGWLKQYLYHSIPWNYRYKYYEETLTINDFMASKWIKLCLLLSCKVL